MPVFAASPGTGHAATAVWSRRPPGQPLLAVRICQYAVSEVPDNVVGHPGRTARDGR